MAARVDVNNMIVAGSKRSDMIRSEQGTRGNVETVSRDQGQCVEDCENAFRDQPAAIVETCSDVVRDGSGKDQGEPTRSFSTYGRHSQQKPCGPIRPPFRVPVRSENPKTRRDEHACKRGPLSKRQKHVAGYSRHKV